MMMMLLDMFPIIIYINKIENYLKKRGDGVVILFKKRLNCNCWNLKHFLQMWIENYNKSAYP